jgi:bifunctional enzyme CysN/CysC
MYHNNEIERMNIVVVGHVDHGKSTVIGRLLADTNSLPEGKLEQVKKYCEKNARPFEYAYLLDALKDEQSQGITIDMARCFFKTKKRQYVIIDAPGHIEFLKNMVTGASRAEAAILVIDAKEGIQENSKRHGYILSFLGIKNIVVLINKMDLINYDEQRFNKLKYEYNNFLQKINIIPYKFIPVSAINGENLAKKSDNMTWYNSDTLLDIIDNFEKEKEDEKKPFRMPVQDVYKFTEYGDDRRIIAGTVLTGKIKINDNIIFLPSNKKAKLKTIEAFNESENLELKANESKGITITPQIYVKRGEIIVKEGEPAPYISYAFKANLFWLGKNPMIKNKKYKIKINTQKETVFLEDIINVIDASELTTAKKSSIDKFDVAQCILKTVKPVVFDICFDNQKTSRFVIIDEYDICGGGIIIEPLLKEKSYLFLQVEKRELYWKHSQISSEARALRFNQKPKFIVLTGENLEKIDNISKKVESELFAKGKNIYYLSPYNLEKGIDTDFIKINFDKDEYIRRIGELARILTDTGLIFITVIKNLEEEEIKDLKILNSPNEIMIINLGSETLDENNAYKININKSDDEIVKEIVKILLYENIILEYYL